MEGLRLYSIGKQTVVMQFVAGIVSTLSLPPRDSISATEPGRSRYIIQSVGWAVNWNSQKTI